MDILKTALIAVVGGVVGAAALEAGKVLVPASVGALLPRMHLIRWAQRTGARIIVPTGALLGLDAVRAAAGKLLDADAAFALGLVTANPDDIDWDDEIRLAIEERVAMSPDALTGLEANLRFNGKETMFTRVFGRLTAWQNWIFQRPNAVGEKGALKVYGKGERPAFDWVRV